MLRMADVELEKQTMIAMRILVSNEVHCWWRVLYSFAEGTWKRGM